MHPDHAKTLICKHLCLIPFLRLQYKQVFTPELAKDMTGFATKCVPLQGIRQQVSTATSKFLGQLTQERTLPLEAYSQIISRVSLLHHHQKYVVQVCLIGLGQPARSVLLLHRILVAFQGMGDCVKLYHGYLKTNRLHMIATIVTRWFRRGSRYRQLERVLRFLASSCVAISDKVMEKHAWHLHQKQDSKLETFVKRQNMRPRISQRPQ